MYPVSLSSEVVSLREFTADDVDGVLAIYGDPQVTRHLSFEPRNREEVTATLASVTKAAQAEPRTEYSLAAVAAGELTAFARLAIDTQHSGQNSGQIGFALRADQWGQGLGTCVVELLLRLGFKELGLHRIWAARSPDNLVSSCLLSKMGMVEEGRIRDHLLVRDRWRDSIVHSILEHEWRG
ncbi:GNAT family N-acetyltransferase [Microtetraspora malaysiensis]|uniref:GNAT family N-acetyltransferase n=1 Tax=Microtetraspora malaysiensis TaxID=161358 RepID=A0ABW6T2V1_9ACTN